MFMCVVGLSGIVWYCAWEMIVHDSPTSHPTITETEKNFIETSISGSDDKAEVRGHDMKGSARKRKKNSVLFSKYRIREMVGVIDGNKLSLVVADWLACF